MYKFIIYKIHRYKTLKLTSSVIFVNFMLVYIVGSSNEQFSKSQNLKLKEFTKSKDWPNAMYNF